METWSKIGKKSQRKGKRGEREFVQFCKKHGFLEVRRGQQYSGIEGEDIVGLPFIHVEVKFYGKKEDLNIQKALEQAIRDADDKIPVVAWRINHQRGWNIVMRTVDFVELFTGEPCQRELFTSVQMDGDEWMEVYKRYLEMKK